jgi:hypothetical protein
MNLLRICSVLVLFCLIGCNRSAPSVSKAKPDKVATPAKSPTVGHPAIEACSLITNEEVSAIQGATIINAQSSETLAGNYLVSQCYYASKEPNMSVSFALSESAPDDRARTHVREYWEQTFGRFGKEGEKEEENEQTKGREREEEREALPPKAIEGVGEKAFWAGNRFGGALYVLQKGFILRISVGGPDKEEIKINKSKALAEKAISRI